MNKNNENIGKITDKAFSRIMLTSVLGILLCLASLCSATWAWFSADVTNQSNSIESGKFDLTVTLLKDSAVATVDDSEASGITVSKDEAGIMTCTLLTKGTYTVKLTMTDDTTVSKGFCIITINGKPYKTASINDDGRNPFIFTLINEEETLTITFEPVWGYPAHSDIEYDVPITVGTQSSDTSDTQSGNADE